MSTTFTPAEVFTPGEYLRDELDEREWTVTEFAEIIGRPIQVVSEILNGKKEITAETAIAFGQALGTSAELWLNLQTAFRLHQKRQAVVTPEVSDVERRARLRDIVPLAEVRKRGWIPSTPDIDQLEAGVCELLRIPKLDDQPSFVMAARRSNPSESLSPQQKAWVAQVRRLALDQPVASALDISTLRALAADLPSRLQPGPSALHSVTSALSECGVRLVFLEGLKGGKLDGAVTFLPDGLPAIGLTTRGNRFDSLVFTLLHECAHLTLQHVTADHDALILDDDLMAEQTDPQELEANERASEWLFPDGFAADGDSLNAILETATRYAVHPSMVIGRIQRETNDWRRFRNRIPKVRPDLKSAGLLA